ncbi:MAG: hypothetical protein ACERKZ_03620 [Lachnotalea sp.]
MGNLFYDKQQFERATKLWETSKSYDDKFTIVLRNLALAYYNKYYKQHKARELLEKAFTLNTKDARIFLELDQLYKILNISLKERLKNYEVYKETFMLQDDLFIEYVTLHNMSGQYNEAYQLIMSRKFHPWEGGELNW